MYGHYEWLLAAIKAHPDGMVSGRTRLQKTIKLLQRKGFPTAYPFSMHFYGPYSESLAFDVELLKALGLVDEAENQRLYEIRNVGTNPLPDVSAFRPWINTLANSESATLELAATYDAFIEMEETPEVALERLQRKKGAKCTPDALSKMDQLLMELELTPR